MNFFAVVFWSSIAAVFYAYAGYPLALFLACRLKEKKIRKGPFAPRISVILSAFNEERHIEEKIHNLLASEYPPEKLEVIIGSDGGSDKTDEIISRVHDPRVKFFRFVSNLGKPHVLNGLVREAHGELLVFTDARQRFEPMAIRKLAENFNDPEVGCVSGELYFEEVKGSGVARGMDAYWKYEKALRKMESRLGSMLGATGAIYAIRRTLYRDIPSEVLVDDMFVPLSIVQKGYRAVFEGEARAYDIISEKSAQEFKRKVRTLAGNYQIFGLFPGLFLPGKSPVAWQFFSHKFLRLMVPFFLVTAFAANLGLVFRGAFYAAIMAGQGAFYGLAGLQYAAEKKGKTRKGPGYIPYMFCLLNYSALVAFFRYMQGRTGGLWQKAYG